MIRLPVVIFFSTCLLCYKIDINAQSNSAHNARPQKNSSFKSGENWYDENGNRINAHGGGILFYNGTYYWYGEIKKGETTRVPDANWENYRVAAGGIACYSSKDLLNWRYEGVALASGKKDTASDL